MNRIQQLKNFGQSIWLDFIRRSYLTSGELGNLVTLGVAGVTSNPSIFEKAIAGSDDYDAALAELVTQDLGNEEIYEKLVIGDIRMAADILLPTFRENAGIDGYVSLEVNPHLAADTHQTINEAVRLFRAVGKPNVMIKIPATPEGIPAIEAAISQGVNVNVTLIFSLEHYNAVAEAYVRGLEKMAASGGDLSKVASVASFFVSRVDTAVDRQLETSGFATLQGKTAIANAKISYARFQEIFQGERWERLAQMGARVQRPLWASTSTKNPAYPDTLYVDNLIGPQTVNTLPPHTLEAFLDHGEVANTLEKGVDQAYAHLKSLEEAGIDLQAVTEQLQVDGVAAFARSFDALLKSIAQKCGVLKSKDMISGGS